MIVLTQIGIFLILICVGVLAVKLRILEEASLAGVSGLVMKIALPCYIFINAVTSATRQSLMQSLIIVPIGIALYIALVLVNICIEKVFGLKGNRQKIYRASFVFGNIGFMGIPLVAAIYPDAAILYVSVFTIVDQLFFWTYGVTLTQPASQAKEGFSLATLKNLVSPPLVAIVLAVIFIVVGIPVPTIAESVLNTIGSTSMPLALIYIGGVLCSANLKPVLKCGELYAGIIVKMIAIPVVAFFVMAQLGLPEDMSATIAYMAALPGIELVPMLAEANGSDGDYAVCAIMMTTITCLITLPIVSLLMAIL